MSDRPFYAPDLKPTPRAAVPGEKLWELRKGSQALTCEVRDDSRRGAGVDVQILEDGEVVFTQRVGRPTAARKVAELLRIDFVGSGWMP